MKKLFACLILSFVFISGVFASTDVQLVTPIGIMQHSYFGEKQMYGFGSAVLSYSDNSFILGPSVSLPVGENVKIQIISGFKYAFMNTSTYMGGISSYSVYDKSKSQIYAWDNDIQVKFTSQKRCSFVIGFNFSFGKEVCNSYQTATTKIPNTTVNEIPFKNDENSYAYNQFFPYIGFSVNF